MYLYFISTFRVQSLKRIKIGYSKNPEARLRDLQTGSPVTLTLLGTIKCRDESHAKSMEKLAHNLFYKQRRRGEWFHLSRKHLAQIKSLIERASARNAEIDAAEMGIDHGLSLDAEYREVMRE